MALFKFDERFSSAAGIIMSTKFQFYKKKILLLYESDACDYGWIRK